MRTLADDLAAGRVAIEAVWDACDVAIATHEPQIQAFVAPETAAARRVRLSTQTFGGPLMGLPFGVKDIFDTAELPTAYGSPIYDGHQPVADAVCVALARRAGGAMYGKTVTTEFASFHPGPTRNPHNLDHTPGGSSSGSAAAVAANMLPVTYGTQTGGSVIRPAAFCGVVGYKPTFNLIPTNGLKTFAWPNLRSQLSNSSLASSEDDIASPVSEPEAHALVKSQSAYPL
ncbi:MAG: amidase, partial [Pseudomonadota bacterium]